MIPIGKLIRKQGSILSDKKKDVKILSLDEQIALLEQSLKDSESDLDNEDNEDNEDCNDNTTTNDLLIIEKDKHGNPLKIVSKGIYDRIMPLPKKYLPDSFTSKSSIKKRKNAMETLLNSEEIPPKIRKKELSSSNNSNHAHVSSSSSSALSSSGMSGLESTIREMLRNYEPASLEKKPFYCRICRFQGTSLDELTEHRESEAHTMAVNIEQKVSFCKLCRKQFTSPAQLQEHLRAKPHKDKLESVRARQVSSKKFC